MKDEWFENMIDCKYVSHKLLFTETMKEST